MLVIELRQERFEDGYYTSARLTTQGRREFQYGRIEARLKVPGGAGTWPAFWMLGADFDNDSDDPSRQWPNVGEIDIMEYVGREPDLVIGTMHGPGYAGAGGLSRWYRQDHDVSQDFHTFAVEWNVDGVRWFYDDELYYEVGRDVVGDREWVFDHPCFIILNLALGGTLGRQHRARPRIPDPVPHRLRARVSTERRVGRGGAMTASNLQHDPHDDEVVFFDDFAVGRLDRTKWNVRVTGPVFNDEQQAYVDSPDTVYVTGDCTGVGSHLTLHPRHRPDTTTSDGQRFDFVSARIDTRDRFQFRYGSAAARIRLPAARGVWPAFWALGCGRWPASGEIDVMEHVGEPDWVSAAVHGPGYSGESGLVNQFFFADGDHAANWHVYSVDWAEDEIVFGVDGRVSFRINRPMVDFRGRVGVRPGDVPRAQRCGRRHLSVQDQWHSPRPTTGSLRRPSTRSGVTRRSCWSTG